MTNETIVIPGLGGICSMEEAFRIGIPVEKNVQFLKRLNYIKTRLYDTMVKHMNRTPEWEVKGAMSLHLWLDAEHVTALRKRVSEMRQPPLHLNKVPDERLEVLMNEVIYANTTIELLTGIFDIIRPALLAAYREHMLLTNPLVDYPTCRILKFMALEEEEMMQWGENALSALVQTEADENERRAWKEHLQAYLTAADGISGVPNTNKHADVPAPRAVEPYEADYVPRRDGRFGDLYNSVLSADEVYLDRSRDAKERLYALLYKRVREMDVPEMQCSIVGETRGQPWEYYLDMGRQIFDEARHSMMGEVGFVHNGVDWKKLPIHINWSLELNTMLTPDERHAILFEIEFGLMPGDTGKKYEWNICREAGYDLGVTFHDHDWADEVLHAQIGKRWIVKKLGGVEQTLELARNAYKKLADTGVQYVSENPNWWNDFYDQVKDKAFPNASIN